MRRTTCRRIDHMKLREVLRGLPSRSLDEIVLAQNTSTEHRMRTPLMAAAESGDLPLFMTVVHAVDASIERQLLVRGDSICVCMSVVLCMLYVLYVNTSEYHVAWCHKIPSAGESLLLRSSVSYFVPRMILARNFMLIFRFRVGRIRR